MHVSNNNDPVFKCTLQGETEESAQFKTEIRQADCSECCRLVGTRDFKQTVELHGMF